MPQIFDRKTEGMEWAGEKRNQAERITQISCISWKIYCLLLGSPSTQFGAVGNQGELGSSTKHVQLESIWIFLKMCYCLIELCLTSLSFTDAWRTASCCFKDVVHRRRPLKSWGRSLKRWEVDLTRRNVFWQHWNMFLWLRRQTLWSPCWLVYIYLNLFTVLSDQCSSQSGWA